MAQWTDPNGVFHNTDNLEYGNQGDTSYWSGTPGAVGSQSYDRPKDQAGAQVNFTVQTPAAPSITAATPAAPGAGYDLSKGYQPLPTGPTYPDYASALAALAKSSPALAGMLSAAAPQPLSPAAKAPVVKAAGIPHGDASLNDTVYSEIAARALARYQGISLEAARTQLQNPAYAGHKDALIGLASQGMLDYLAPEFGAAPAQTGASALPTAGQSALDQVAQANGYGGWDEYSSILQKGAQEQAALARQKAEQDLALAKNADDRAAASLDIQKADQQLSQSQYETSKQQYQASLVKSLLDTASQLRGPRNYAQFLQYASGGRDLLSQVLGSEPRAAFSALTGPVEPASLGGLLSDLTGGGSTQQPAQQLPQPFQINPAVWDALGPVGQQMMLSAAEAAGYDPNEFLAQLNAARPVGKAARSTQYTFAAPQAA
ncbi:MAG: hypothetical protein M0Z94_19725 [Dehalococcoidales bacterium]|nr:hypothetical protein [Dehalococcoidales bacterium]